MDDQTPTDDKKRSERISRLRRRLWFVSMLISLACLTVLVGATMMLNRMATGLRLPVADGALRRLAREGFA
jgi:hypothetical protein